VLRGGSWLNYGRDVRSAFRFALAPGYRDVIVGFRLARGQAKEK
jgi:formylglycine-generating enzyme required for sulfatase activity